MYRSGVRGTPVQSPVSLPGRGLSFIWVFVVVGLLLAPAAAAHHWGIHSFGEDGGVEAPGDPGPYWVCVAAQPWAAEIALHPGSGAEPVVFRPEDEGPDCQRVDGGRLQVEVPSGHEVLALVVVGEPREASTPGVVRLGRAGVAFEVGRVSDATELGIMIDRSGHEVRLFRALDLHEVGRTVEVGETRFVPTEDTPWTGGVFVVLTEGDTEGTVLVDWKDPAWFREAPTVGHVAMVVAIALFVMLYHGPSKRRMG